MQVLNKLMKSFTLNSSLNTPIIFKITDNGTLLLPLGCMLLTKTPLISQNRNAHDNLTTHTVLGLGIEFHYSIISKQYLYTVRQVNFVVSFFVKWKLLPFLLALTFVEIQNLPLLLM